MAAGTPTIGDPRWLVMRKLTLCFLGAMLLAACGGGARTLQTGEKPRVIASTVHLASLAMAVAGDDAVVEALVPDGASSHDYELTVADRKRLREAHLLLVNGLGLESFDAAKVAAGAGATLVDCSAGIPEDFFIETDGDDGHNHGHDHGAHNPHVWLCAEGAILQARAIADALAALDPDSEEGYRKRFDELKASFEKLRDEFRPRLAALQKKNFVSNHDAFPYLAREYGLKQVGVIQRTPGHNPTIEERRKIELLLARGEAHAIFMEPGYDDAASRAIAESGKLPLATLNPFDSGTPGPEALQQVLRQNLETVLKTLGD